MELKALVQQQHGEGNPAVQRQRAPQRQQQRAQQPKRGSEIGCSTLALAHIYLVYLLLAGPPPSPDYSPPPSDVDEDESAVG
ncbi:hypothetical protein CYMTET_23900 [Cymbomonas tetramitiformis]|uniref:Uncharacterized protein n=1 Tax=Cymbomonas tetramitiformis TaxID=36881 RepID=A0AAE0FWV8_9CHLO|nr:hypothetical protein CYMTET_23900 [Cymbomonas tetramitiformis]